MATLQFAILALVFLRETPSWDLVSVTQYLGSLFFAHLFLCVLPMTDPHSWPTQIEDYRNSKRVFSIRLLRIVLGREKGAFLLLQLVIFLFFAAFRAYSPWTFLLQILSFIICLLVLLSAGGFVVVWSAYLRSHKNFLLVTTAMLLGMGWILFGFNNKGVDQFPFVSSFGKCMISIHMSPASCAALVVEYLAVSLGFFSLTILSLKSRLFGRAQ